MKVKKFKQVVIVVFLFVFSLSIAAARYPQEVWQQYKTLEEAGFSSAKLDEAKKLYDSLNAAAYLVIYDGRVLVSWGDVKRRFGLHSVRKSLISGLYGIHVAEGTIDLNKTLEELNITDKTPPTKEEKQARVIHLLKARSGVYIPAAAETPGMKARRPKRGSRAPDTFWYYNNWDFNVLGTILEQEVETDIFADFKMKIAEPLQMEDFKVYHGMHYVQAEYSNHAAYHFRMSARDLGRFGLLYLRDGKWNGKQIIPEKWIKQSRTSYSSTGLPDFYAGYGYLWWIADFEKAPGMYSAFGVGSQIIHVIPSADMVIVQRVNTYENKYARPNKELVEMILDARIGEPKPNPQLIPLQNTPSYKRPKIIKLKPEVMDKLAREYSSEAGTIKITKKDGYLMAETYESIKLKLLPISETKFVVEDLERIALIEFDDKGEPFPITVCPSLEIVDFYVVMMKQGAASAVKWYKDKREKDKNVYHFSEAELNRLGYGLMELKKIKDAIEIFKLYAELYPISFRVYNSLGEAYLNNGDYQLAIQNYKKSLELNPRNKNAEKRLKEINNKK
jgi:CubicO group peptidase (beta-lactamase class C family)